MSGVYLKNGDEYVAMTETPFAAEEKLQALIAQHPEVLVDDAEGPLLLLRREAGVSAPEDGSGRWRLDHLYLDGNGVPTLVEVKRSSDTRGRREVVAQMLDYAANAKLSFGAGQMAAWLEADAERRETSAALRLSEVLGVDDPDAFWASVATNLDAERFRLIFVADVIPAELRRIVEFLNEQMTRTEVLAIEVKQYVDMTGRDQVIVPRVIGNTESAKLTKRTSRSAPRIDRDSLIASLSETDPRSAVAANALLDWAGADPNLNIRWNTAGDIGLAIGYGALMRLWSDGTLEVKVETLRHIDPRWDDDARIEQLLERLEEIDGIAFWGNRPRWPGASMSALADPKPRDAFLRIIGEVIRELVADE